MRSNTLLVCLTCLTLSSVAFSAENTKTTKKEATNNNVDISNGTDVVGSKDAPLILNIVPWKDKENALPKNPLSASVLQESLAPIERDVVSREVGYSRALQELLPLSTVSP
jgi:hypothetical protein